MNSSAMTAVLIIGDKDVSSRLILELKKNDLSFLSCPDIESFLLEGVPSKGALYFIDSSLTGVPSVRLIELIRSVNKVSPIFVLLESHDANTGTAFLEAGADDCFTGSESIPYVFLKAMNQFRKTMSMTAGNIDQGLKLLPEGYMILKHGKKLKLTPTEFKITQALIALQDEVLSRSSLIEFLEDSGSTERTIDVHISALRKKLSEIDIEIKTFRGKGYRVILNLDANIA